jgi:glycosyltransferase involved in cell wall biosynthesis
MNICYLASAKSVHTRRWVNYFASKGHSIELVSFEQGEGYDSRVVIHALPRRLPLNLDCFFAGSLVRSILRRSKIDILHAHYASSYGTIGRYCNFHPYIVSVWGSDVFEFPRRSPLHRMLLRRNLASADKVCSTSKTMASEIHKYCANSVEITPFGIDCAQFQPSSSDKHSEGEFVVGTVKSLEPVYGIEYLIRAFALLVRRYTGKTKLRLVIAGDGYLLAALQALTRELKIEHLTRFVGHISHEQVPQLLRKFSVFANLSNNESFGVAALEASACGLPVIATNVGNLPEIIRNLKTGIIVPARDPQATSEALFELLNDDQMRVNLGQAGRQFVLKHYDWIVNAIRLEDVYRSVSKMVPYHS